MYTYIYIYCTSSTKRHDVYFILLMARKAFIRGWHLLEGAAFVFF